MAIAHCRPGGIDKAAVRLTGDVFEYLRPGAVWTGNASGLLRSGPPHSGVTVMRLHPAIAGAAFLLVSHAGAARAATVFFYSEPEPYYGWAAGYSYGKSERLARQYCKEGGADCKFVLECDGGWSAVAFPDNFAKGVAFSCGFASAAGARTVALANCMAESKTLCWTSSTIGGSGNERSEKDNLAFDMTWYAQQILYARGFDPGSADGEMGGKTRAALRAFQTKLGLDATGEVDDAIFQRLLDAASGRSTVAAAMKRDLVDPKRDELGDAVYAHAQAPYAIKSFSEEIATRPDDQRRLTLATVLSVRGTPCTLPAKDAVPFPEDGSGGLWLVACNEGEWTVLIADGSILIMPGLDTGGGEAEAPGDNPPADPEAIDPPGDPHGADPPGSGAPRPGPPATPGAPPVRPPPATPGPPQPGAGAKAD